MNSNASRGESQNHSKKQSIVSSNSTLQQQIASRRGSYKNNKTMSSNRSQGNLLRKSTNAQQSKEKSTVDEQYSHSQEQQDHISQDGVSERAATSHSIAFSKANQQQKTNEKAYKQQINNLQEGLANQTFDNESSSQLDTNQIVKTPDTSKPIKQFLDSCDIQNKPPSMINIDFSQSYINDRSTVQVPRQLTFPDDISMGSSSMGSNSTIGVRNTVSALGPDQSAQTQKENFIQDHQHKQPSHHAQSQSISLNKPQQQQQKGLQNHRQMSVSKSGTGLRRSVSPIVKQRVLFGQNSNILNLHSKQASREQSPLASARQSQVSHTNNNVKDQRDASRSIINPKSQGVSMIYQSGRKNSQSRSIISSLYPKEKKLSIDYFLGTTRRTKEHQLYSFKETLKNIVALLEEHVPNGHAIINNLKVIFFEHSVFVEGGTMGSTVQPINQNMMTLYLFHQFMKRYTMVMDHQQSLNYEMIFVEVANKQNKKIDFNQFGTVLAKMSIKMYVDESYIRNVEQLDPLECILKLINDYLFSLTNLDDNSQQDLQRNNSIPEEKSIHSSSNRELSPQTESTKQPGVFSVIEQVDNEFDKYRIEYETSAAKKTMNKDRKILDQIFNGYSKASKRGVKIIALRQFKQMLRDLSIIPHITTEYKCGQLFKYLDSSKKTVKDYPEEILTQDTFPLSIYIIFALILESDTPVDQKTSFILKWLREHSRDKPAGVHACREDKRLKFTNERLQQMSSKYQK